MPAETELYEMEIWDAKEEMKLEAAWTRLLQFAKRQVELFATPERQVAESIYFELLQKVEQERRAGNVVLSKCPSNDAWEGACSDVSCIVSPYCIKHAVLYDDRQVFFTFCDQCRRETGSNHSVAFWYNRSANSCLHHIETARKKSRRLPIKRRVTDFAIQTEKLQMESAKKAFEDFMSTHSTLATALLRLASLPYPSYIALTPPTSPNPAHSGSGSPEIPLSAVVLVEVAKEIEEPHQQNFEPMNGSQNYDIMADDIMMGEYEDLEPPSDLLMVDLSQSDDVMMNDVDTPLDLDVQETLLSQPLPQEQYEHIVKDVLTGGLPHDVLLPASQGSGEELLSSSVESMFSTEVKWTLRVLEEMDRKAL